MCVQPIMMRRDGVAIEQTPDEAVRAVVAFRKRRPVPGQLGHVVYVNVYSIKSVRQVTGHIGITRGCERGATRCRRTSAPFAPIVGVVVRAGQRGLNPFGKVRIREGHVAPLNTFFKLTNVSHVRHLKIRNGSQKYGFKNV